MRDIENGEVKPHWRKYRIENYKKSNKTCFECIF